MEIFDIHVGSERGVGKGRRLIGKLLLTVRTHFVYAITRSSNEIARDFYAAVGFREIAVLSGFYNEDRILDAKQEYWVEGVRGDGVMFGIGIDL